MGWTSWRICRQYATGMSLCIRNDKGTAVCSSTHVQVVELDIGVALGRTAGGKGSGACYPRAVSISHDGSRIAVGTSTNEIVCYDRSSGQIVPHVIAQGHWKDVWGLAADPCSPS
eukprot:SAG31_NODE_4827_length_2922_cov_1.410556_1_plen_114_part_10